MGHGVKDFYPNGTCDGWESKQLFDGQGGPEFLAMENGFCKPKYPEPLNKTFNHIVSFVVHSTQTA